MENFSGFFDLQLVYQTLIASGLGGLVFMFHGFLLNPYLITQNMFLTALMLPPVALVITTAIATNFYLALGMIGALSIIRYRTPVKSQYDLALLFALVTIGVVGGVNLSSAAWIALFLILLAPSFKIVSLIIPARWMRKSTFSEKGQNRLIATIKGDVSNNLSILELGGKLVSIDVFTNDQEKSTSIHLQFPSIEKCIAAKEKINKSAEILTASIS